MERLGKYNLAQLERIELLLIKKIAEENPEGFFEDEVKFIDELLEYHQRGTISAQLCVLYLAKTAHKVLRKSVLN